MVDIAKKADNPLKTNIPIIMINKEQRQHVTNTNCNLYTKNSQGRIFLDYIVKHYVTIAMLSPKLL